ncbi:MAG TPA: excinuclease ABC subunit UvrC [Candidatus Aphodocola excrementigallinarum]|uniref:UvrABC system protein C n=1 Tax=Candidatus Aphodocola excrementigallinarum TaxID=2840670 RepID=A0A9D1LHT1_9FIRM|nr:excinuclease ABC subunit UvrC [Candidatus Aphodocola excrementigallinarum]
MDKIKEKLKLLTTEPGCYLMKDETGKVIYVGKAKNLKRRVSSYFNREHTGKTKALVQNIKNFEYIVTASEVESLLLEINLIKKYSPKYNILLKDNKSYPYIEITDERYPRLIISRPRKIKGHKGKLFGPYPNASAARQTVQLLNRIYPFRKCHTMQKKVCLYYHIGQCLGYCEKKIDKQVIKEMISEVTSFLHGNYDEVRKKIKSLMIDASNKLNFERAIEYKQMLEYIDTVLEKQKISLNDNVTRDVINYYVKNDYISFQVLHLRDGRINMRDGEVFPLIDDVKDTLSYFVTSFYDKNDVPKEVLVTEDFDCDLLENAINTKFIVPQKGVKKQLVEMAYENAKIVLDEKFELIVRDDKRTFGANEALGKLIGIPNLKRIETFDNAHLFGTFTVSGMVVFTNGKPDKKEYRKYKITSGSKDDYHTMQEVIYRRYYRVLHDKLEKPDLIIVDGGIIQVHAAKEVLDNLYLDIPVLGLKKNDKHTTTALISEDKEYEIDKTSDVFHLLTRIQDEVHRFTINYHKDIRSKGSLSSILDNVPGIGAKRKKELLKKYKTITKLKSLTKEELATLLPDNVAENLYEFLKEYKKD